MQAADCVIYSHQYSSVQPRQALEIEGELMRLEGKLCDLLIQLCHPSTLRSTHIQLSSTSTKTCSFDSRKKGKMVTLAGRREDVLKYEDVAISVPVPSSSDASNG